MEGEEERSNSPISGKSAKSKTKTKKIEKIVSKTKALSDE
jgi:hypothetical protein